MLFGAWIAATVDWRAAFLWVGLAGLAVAPLFRLIVREPARPEAQRSAEPVRRVFAILARKRSFWFLAFGVASSSMLGYGLASWLPSLMARSFGMALPEIGRFYGALLLIGGAAGVLAGGFPGIRVRLHGSAGGADALLGVESDGRQRYRRWTTAGDTVVDLELPAISLDRGGYVRDHLRDLLAVAGGSEAAYLDTMPTLRDAARVQHVLDTALIAWDCARPVVGEPDLPGGADG